MTEQEQRKLTEFLGEEWDNNSESAYWWCPHCLEEVDGSRVTFSEKHDTCLCPVVIKEARLDFTDWRVVGRLIEKVDQMWIETSSTKKWAASPPATSHWFYGDTPQEAICRAVLAYLEN